MTRLFDRWAAVLSPWVPPGDSADAGATLLARYAEPQRRYHTAAHLEAMIDALFLDLADDPAAVELAAFFHDAVYDPRAPAGENERASAALAATSLSSLGVPAAVVRRVRRLVLTTADHVAAGNDADAAVLNDADLAVLGGQLGEYAGYVAAVRAEYGWLNREEWRSGRALVLEALLARPWLYATARGRARWEAVARANMGAELGALRGDGPAGR
jgi:predicted metal-dependent HD superfamily phosphohydrolase